jgi:hypothetical protein
MPTNMRIGLNVMRVANTLAYYDSAIITSVKSFKVKALGVNVIHPFCLSVMFSQNKLGCLSPARVISLLLSNKQLTLVEYFRVSPYFARKN